MNDVVSYLGTGILEGEIGVSKPRWMSTEFDYFCFYLNEDRTPRIVMEGGNIDGCWSGVSN